MNIKSQAIHLQTFLSHYTLMWNEEIMNEYPRSLKNYPKEWIDLLETLDAAELYAVDCKQIPEKIKESSFAQFMTDLQKLSELPEIDTLPEIPLEDWAFNGVKKKKKHEIQKIVPVLKKLKDTIHYETVIDIGGGVGHLGRVLSHYHAIHSVSLDRDLEFQKIGRERLKKYRRIDGAGEVSFVHMNFGEPSKESDELLKAVFKPTAFTLGLHTCGNLANAVLFNSIKFKTRGLLSFGCCYHRLHPQNDYPLSQFYKTNSSLLLNPFSLCLATRSHVAMTKEFYQTKEQVKKYRYALHLFLMKKFDLDSFIEVGECHIKTYWLPFSHYIRQKLDELKLPHSYTDQDFDQFYNSEELQQELKLMFLCNIIRWQLGRALEVYLLLDRCLFLEEHGYIVEIAQYFKEALSPRNIGILALNK